MRETGGGRYDRDEGFCYFLAGVINTLGMATRHTHTLVAVNDILGSGQGNLRNLPAVVESPEQKVILDSGIFWLATTHAERNGLTMDQALALPPDELDGWERLTGAYIDLVRKHEHDLWGYVELDQGGADRKRETRAWLEAEGLRPIPVYHPLVDGWEYLDELLDAGYDRLMIGNVVQARWEVRDRIIFTVWERVRRVPRERRPWLHLLGLGPYPTLAACPFNSADTSNHVQSMQYGGIIPGAMAMGPFSKLFGYLYDREALEHEETGYRAYGRLLGWIGDTDERAWRAQQGDLEQLLGVGLYPDPLEREPEPRPEAAA